MAERDVAPELLEKIKKDFENRISSNEAMAKLSAKLDEAGGFKEAEHYALEVGKELSAAFQGNLSSEVLPNGRMYYNIADRVITPMMEEEYELAAEAGMKAVSAANERAGVRIAPQEPIVDEDRVQGIIDKIAEAEWFDDVKWLLGSPVQNFAVHCVDKTVEQNASFLHSAGRQAKIVRDSASKCCDWCADLDGTYEYPGVPRDVFARHENCNCTVEYVPGDGRVQDVYSKSWRDEEAIEARKTLQEETERGILKQEPIEAPASAPREYDRFEGLELLNLTEIEKIELKTLRDLTTKDGLEHLFILYPDGTKESFSGEADKVGYILKDGKDGVKLFHSHTNNTSFSDQDIEKLLNWRISQIGVITPDGSIFTMSVGNGWVPEIAELNLVFDETMKSANEIIHGVDSFNEWSLDERLIVARDEQNILIAHTFEWDYRGGNLDE